MALTLVDPLLVKQRALAETRRPAVQAQLKALFSHVAQHKGNPTLQFVPFAIAAADIVIADVACKLYALYYAKPSASTTAAWIKGSDHATVAAAAGDIVLPLTAAASPKPQIMVFPDGLPLATGLTIASHTAVDGNTDSATAERGVGFAIVGAA